MALIAHYEINGDKIKNAYFQIRRVWGSKAEGWNAQVGVALNQLAADQNIFVMDFDVRVDFSASPPFPLLYEAARQYLKDRKIKAKDHLQIVDNAPKAETTPMGMLQLLHDNLNDLKAVKNNKDVINSIATNNINAILTPKSITKRTKK